MKFHVVSLPHTNTTKGFVNCAYTEKVRRFCMMMKALDHEVILYAGTENEAPVDELVTCLPEVMRKAACAGRHYTSASFDLRLPHWRVFNATAIKEMRKRISDRDFICVIGGHAQKEICDAFPGNIAVEFGVGYSGVFSSFRVFESYAWMHSIYGGWRDPATADGRFYDTVIPGYLEPDMFPMGSHDGDYYLYIGRLVDRKGFNIAQETCQRLGKRLILAGPGDQKGYGEFVGPVGPEERAKLMGGAIATFAPTLYVEPFGNVVIEAHCCGTPTITTDWGAFTETNIHGFTGYRCRTLNEFIQAALAAPGLDHVRIRDHAVQNYSLEVIGKRYEAYFLRLSDLWKQGWYEVDSKLLQTKANEPRYSKGEQSNAKAEAPDDIYGYEKTFWGDCTNTFAEDQKQYVYAKHMGLRQQYYSLDAQGKTVLDIGGGPTSMLLKTFNLKRGKVVDPIAYPQWTVDRYKMKNIEVLVEKAENISESEWDEVWIYNCLQHVVDPKVIIEKAKKAANVLRIFEWIDIPPHQGHPHMLTEAELDLWIGQKGKVVELEQINLHGRAYCGVFNFNK